jgi:hypothetical protein
MSKLAIIGTIEAALRAQGVLIRSPAPELAMLGAVALTGVVLFSD